MGRLYDDIELGFVPIIKNDNLADFFKPGINLSQPILFRPGNRIMILFMSMFLSLNGLSDALYNGSYEFMSRVRVAYLKKERVQKALNSLQEGGDKRNSKKLDKMLEDQENTLLGLAEIVGGKRGYKRQTKKRKHTKCRTQKTQKKY